jgi:hypothetical protein
MKGWIFTIAITLLFVAPNMASAFSASPALIDVTAALGGQAMGEFTLLNTTDSEKTFYLSTQGFKSSSDAGAPEFYETDDENEFANWIRFEKKAYTLTANSREIVPFTAKVLSTVPAGGYYAAIMISEAPSEIVASNGAIVQATLAIPCFLTVEGASIEKLEIVDLSSALSGLQSSFSGNIDVTVENQGTIHLAPEGMVEIKDIFGRSLAAASLNEKEGRVLPSSRRTFSIFVWEEVEGFWSHVKAQSHVFAIGPMSIQASVLYGSNDSQLIFEKTFIYFPWQLLLVVTILIILLLTSYRLAFRLQSRVG